MALILNIETSTKSTSVALAKDGELLSLIEEHEVVSHATKLTPFIEEALKKVNTKLTDLDAIAISNGPGSYTGLRIGLSAAKGLCYILDIPLIEMSGLKSMAYYLRYTHIKKYKLYVSIMNSRKNEVYLSSINSSLDTIHKPSPVKVDENFLLGYEETDILMAGSGWEKLDGNIKHINITFIEGIKFSAKNMVKPTFKLFEQGLFADLAYSEPDYLKPFISK
jgi:tRNA threonylcarbamoyladenosine biosynthesis protein TsaB